jgi:choline-sulfatase
MSDQHQAALLGIDSDILHTPNLDRLASEGTVFDRAYTTCPLCVPARMSFMTARHPHDIDVLENNYSLNSHIPTFAHSVGTAGYEAVLAGRMHFNGDDQKHGFADRLVGDVGSRYPGYNLEVGPFTFNAGATSKALLNSGAGTTAIEHFDSDVTDASIDYLKKNADKAEKKPFCLVTGFYRPHSPYRAPRKYFDIYDGKVSLPERKEPTDETSYVKNYRDKSKMEDATVEDELRSLTAYYGLITEMDENIGKILTALDETGLSDNTVVIYTSDHGDHAGDHNLWWKQSFYDSSARIPLIVRIPGQPGGKRNNTPVSIIDIAETANDIAGAEPLPFTAGESLLPFITGDKQEKEDCVLSELGYHPGQEISVPSRMVVKDNFKYIYYNNPEFSEELYNLDEDPQENNNLAEDSSLIELKIALRKKIFADGWDPYKVKQSCERASKEAYQIALWTKAVQPEDPGHYTGNIDPRVNVNE